MSDSIFRFLSWLENLVLAESIRGSLWHSLLKVKYSGKLWTVYLAPTSRMTARGLTADMIKEGAAVRIVAYPHKTVKTEMRAERIFVGDQKFELR